MQAHEAVARQGPPSPRKQKAGGSACLGLLCLVAATFHTQKVGPTPTCFPKVLYLEPFELTFHIYFQCGEHGLVLVGQVLESVQATLTVTL